MSSTSANKWFIAVHAGAGYHSDSSHNKLRSTMNRAMRVASRFLESRESEGGPLDPCVEAVTAAISVLEDCPLTNAGVGSNMTIAGTIECDACLMHGGTLASGAAAVRDGPYRYASVGACRGVRNPIRLARHLMERSSLGKMRLGRIRPAMMSGAGCWKYLHQTRDQHSLVIAPSDQDLDGLLVTDASHRRYQNHMNRLRQHAQTPKGSSDGGTISSLLSNIFTARQGDRGDVESTLYDTVGAICMESSGRVAAGVSSGGISLKMEGRIGEAAIAGAGCWADSQNGIACSLTGTGEDIMLNMSARQFAQDLQDAEASMVEHCARHALDRNFMSYTGDHTRRNVGMIALKRDDLDDNDTDATGFGLDFCWAYTTETMAVGYLSSGMDGKCVSFVSKAARSDNHQVNAGVVRI